MKAKSKLDKTKTLPYQYVADNEQAATCIARYMTTVLGFHPDDVTQDGSRVLYKHVPAANANRLLGFIDGIREGLVGVP